jgi:hypothetical protein
MGGCERLRLADGEREISYLGRQMRFANPNDIPYPSYDYKRSIANDAITPGYENFN